ncbi:signal peptidase I [Cellulomonas sp. NPDC058312]|uniref:signal peptidase I n=1 Tax=Cellulomonas sp. NPDC058312 TaxID=3346441 RepID=UPI0036ED0256
MTTDSRTVAPPTRRPALRAPQAPPADRSRSTALRVLDRVQKTLLDVGAVLGTISVVVVVLCLVTGVRPAVVVSGSMAPGIPVGALTVARSVDAASVAVGDVVTLPRQDGEGLVTHRVIEVAPGAEGGATELRLQGDANAEPDARAYTVDRVGLVLGSVPHLGRLVLGLQQNVVAVVAGLLVLTAVATFPTSRRGRA